MSNPSTVMVSAAMLTAISFALMAWVAAALLHPAAEVGYYGGRIGDYASETLSAPVMLHFGKQDTHIPAEEVEKVHATHPEVEIYWYDA
jgi:carboxymethylenebutenolidase